MTYINLAGQVFQIYVLYCKWQLAGNKGEKKSVETETIDLNQKVAIMVSECMTKEHHTTGKQSRIICIAQKPPQFSAFARWVL